MENKKELNVLSLPIGDVSDIKSIAVLEQPRPVKGQKGRPKKSQIAAKKKGNRGAVGRPAGDSARIAEFKA